jgi:hypothetical protein
VGDQGEHLVVGESVFTVAQQSPGEPVDLAVVGDSAGVVEQLSDGDPVGAREARHEPVEGVRDRQPALVRQLQHDGGDEQFGDAGDAEPCRRGDRFTAVTQRRAGHPDPSGSVRALDGHRHRRHARPGAPVVHEGLRPAAHRRVGRPEHVTGDRGRGQGQDGGESGHKSRSLHLDPHSGHV